MTENRVACKICRIKDLHIAKFCAEVGADFIGLHAIWGIRQENLATFKQIAEMFPKIYPRIGIVLVTRQKNLSDVIEMVQIIKPTHVQLHAPWPANSIVEIRRELQRTGYGDTRLIGVVALKVEPIERVDEIAPRVDLVLLDSLIEGGSGQTVDLSLLQEAKNLSGTTPVLIAGGLTPENVKYYVEAVHPFGVDVQTAVEYPDRPGVKDPNRVVAFIKTAKG